YGRGDEDYNNAADLAQLPDLSAIVMPYETKPLEPEWVDPYADALSAMDFAALREVNDDVLGWILIPDSAISYPMVQGSNNSYYLKRTWRLTSSVVGAIFLDAQCDDDFSDFNTIIYGHRMNNGSMFAGLAKYKNYSYYKSHPAVYISDDNGSRAYQIFAAYEVSVTGDTYRLGITSEKDKQAYIDYCLSQSLYDTGVVPTVYDSIVTLSTCTGRGHATRWVVQAVIRGEAPPAESVTEEVDEEVPAETETPAETQTPSATVTPPAVTESPVEEVPPATETESEETVTGDDSPFVPDLDSETIPAA
ncbi:MAG: class B sortase, partial [Oscillospiraceae bacterium]|nr:class B sortase [Oscillospiraceae bacterium]